ncbi:hypothetical protein M9H77_26651 [Catharanthus roseus]|uniref:Uncharacterized protein n=1 Tax=Catharanthus roseus TaxID=4058 RepID=A0ACC0AD02_CATRO|nr:hypothetical protein M9H77_26651 [Catharanthus roseus]
MSRLTDPDGSTKAQCIWCKKKLVSGGKVGTTHLTKHLKVCVARKLRCKGQQQIQHSISNLTEHANIAYTCLTAHFVDDNWELKKKILAYRHIPYPHDGLAVVLDPRFKMNLVEFYYDAIYGSDAYPYKTPIGFTSFRLLYGKSCYLPVEV